MPKFKVACSGYVVVEVEATNPKDAQRIVEEEVPGATGELYNLQVEEVVPADDGFKQLSDFN